MKAISFLLFILFSLSVFTQAQTKPVKKKSPPPKTIMKKMMEDALKGEDMTAEEKAMMNDVMKEMSENQVPPANASYPDFKDNKTLVPKKDVIRINSISKKQLNENDINTMAISYYTKLMAKIPASDKSTITQKLATYKTGKALSNEATTAMLDGNMNVALGLELKAVQLDNKNLVTQNNLAAILTQAGYPEKAIPILKKLSTQFPDNSTILNNMGNAWLNLGEMDSSRRYFAGAKLVNPRHPEATLCGGLLEELKGDPLKAADEYDEAFKNMPNPMADKMAKNAGGENIPDTRDFDNLFNQITIYPYFGKEWITIPVLSSNVYGFSSDIAIINGYDKMLERVSEKLNKLLDDSNEQMNANYDQSLKAQFKGFVLEANNGISMMSLPALYIQQILSAYQVNWMKEYLEDVHKLNEWKEIQREILSKAINIKDSKCEDWNVAANEYLRKVNNRSTYFYKQKLLEYQRWMNTWCTWSWYVAGNPYNVTLSSCYSWASAFLTVYTDAIESLEYQKIYCKDVAASPFRTIRELPIPEFNCPIVVKMPLNLNEIEITAQTVGFSANANTKSTNTIPNSSISYSADNQITEPGRYGDPYFKTANGSISFSGFSNNSGMGFAKSFEQAINELWVDIHNQGKEQMPLADPKLFRKNKTINKADIDKLAKAAFIKELLHSMLSTTCKTIEAKPQKPKKYILKTGLGPVQFLNEETGEWEIAENKTNRNESKFKFSIGEVILEDVPEPEGKFGLGVIELYETDPKTGEIIPEGGTFYDPDTGITSGFGKITLEDVTEPTKLQTVINNALQYNKLSSSGVKGFIKGLFD